MAPERLLPGKDDSAKATPESDVFSFAMLVVEVRAQSLLSMISNTKYQQVYTGDVPFGRKVSEAQCIVRIAFKRKRPTRPPNVPDAIWRIVEDCWQDSPRRRPVMMDVYTRFARM